MESIIQREYTQREFYKKQRVYTELRRESIYTVYIQQSIHRVYQSIYRVYREYYYTQRVYKVYTERIFGGGSF